MSALLVLIPIGVTIAGGVLAAFRRPGRRLVAAVQHVAAGAVLGAVTAELVFELIEARALGALIAGFSVGTVTMLALRTVTDRLEAGRGGSSAGLVVAVALDVLIDGVVIGIGLAAGGSAGVLLTAALTIELAFLGVAVAGDLGAAGGTRGRIVGVTSGLAGLLACGAGIGTLLGELEGFGLDAVLAFAAAALLYLVTEELLREAHELEDTRVATALFFLAFLAVVALDIAG